MKSSDLIVVGLAGLAVYLIAKSGKLGAITSGGALTTRPVTTTSTAGVRSVTDTVAEIFNTVGRTFDNGWRYFTDGTAIDPSGNYYYQGQLVWNNPQAMYSA
jgi:hypothetical protein